MSSEFIEVALLRDPEGLGLVAPITVRRRDNGFVSFSFALFKEFERGGPTQRTSYLNKRHIGAARKLLDQIEERIMVEQDKLSEERRAK